MKKTIEFANKIIVIFDHDDCIQKTEYNTFEEAYEAMKHRYTDKEGLWWDIEDWDAEFDFEEAKGKFETYGYVEFCDRDEITTTLEMLNRVLDKIL